MTCQLQMDAQKTKDHNRHIKVNKAYARYTGVSRPILKNLKS